MRSIPRHEIFAAAAMAALLTGCEGQWSAVVDPGGIGDPTLMITWVTVTPDQFQVGETAQVEVGFKNPTHRAIRMQFNSGCWLSYVVRNVDDDDVVGPRDRACTTDAPTIVFPAGESGTKRFTWDGTTGRGQALPPGQYRVVGGFTEAANVQPSAPVTIQILAP